MKRAEKFFAELAEAELADPPLLEELKERGRRLRKQRALAGTAAAVVVVAALQATLTLLPLPRTSLLLGDPAIGQSTWERLDTPPPLRDVDGQEFPLLTAWADGTLYAWSGTGEGSAFDLDDRAWTQLPTRAPVAFGPDASAVWTGDEVLLWGPDETGARKGAGLHPDTGRWRVLADDPLDQGLSAEAVWTGSELVVWGGFDHQPDLPAEGAAYNPETDSWRRIAEAPLRARQSHTAVWAGDRLIVWGGTDLVNDDFADGAEYDPGTDTWTVLPPAPIAGRTQHSMLWTGTEMLVWGGETGSGGASDGAVYSPATKTWHPMAAAPIAGRYWHAAVWTGTRLVVWGGYDFSADETSFADGASYDPALDRWELLPPGPLPGRCLHTAAWTVRGLLVFGGTSRCGSPAPPLTDGALLVATRREADPGGRLFRPT